MNNKYIKSLGGEEHIEMLGTEGRITAGEESRRDEWQQTIRPQRLSDYIGQSTFKENLHVYISAARSRKKHLTMYCFTDRLVLAKPRWQKLFLMNWEFSLR